MKPDCCLCNWKRQPQHINVLEESDKDIYSPRMNNCFDNRHFELLALITYNFLPRRMNKQVHNGSPLWN